jgi:hypothetical protein
VSVLQALLGARRLLKHHPPVLVPHVHALVLAIAPAIEALRSGTARGAMHLIQVSLPQYHNLLQHNCIMGLRGGHVGTNLPPMSANVSPNSPPPTRPPKFLNLPIPPDKAIAYRHIDITSFQPPRLIRWETGQFIQQSQAGSYSQV